jgi:poly-gamma-glutamate synthesis protein (capsule biosynthesis protein)
MIRFTIAPIRVDIAICYCLFALLATTITSCSGGEQEAVSSSTSIAADTTVTLVFGGDMMSHMPQVNAAWNPESGRHEYEHWFQFVKPTISEADLAIANLETTLNGQPYTGYPCFSAPDAFAYDLKRVGFDVLVTANNHVADKGRRGIERTIEVLDSFGIQHTGSYRTQAERDSSTPLVVNVKGIRIAILSYTYSTNGMPVSNPNVVDLINDSLMAKDIAKARSRGAHVVIPVMHWGNEYQTTEHPTQQKTAQFLASKGADAIIGMHPHVLQPIKKIAIQGDTVPVVYSLGNFVANMRDRYQNGGAMVQLQLTRRNGSVSITSFEDVPFFVWKGPLEIRDTLTQKVIRHRMGYYAIPESMVSNLPSKGEAIQFFDDARKILRGSDKTSMKK